MRRLRLSVVGIVILGLLGGVGGVMAQTADEEAAPAELPTGPAEFTIIEFDGLNIVATDPRMSGAATEGTAVFSRTLPTGHFVASVPLRIRNDAGKWECFSSEYGTVGTESYWPWYSQSWCVGEGTCTTATAGGPARPSAVLTAAAALCAPTGLATAAAGPAASAGAVASAATS